MDRPEFPPRPLAEVLDPDDYGFVREKLLEAKQTPAEDVYLSEPTLTDREILGRLVKGQSPLAETLGIRYLFKTRDRRPAFTTDWVERAPANVLDPLGTAAANFVVFYTDEIEKYEKAQEAKKRRGEAPQSTAASSADGSSNSS